MRWTIATLVVCIALAWLSTQFSRPAWSLPVDLGDEADFFYMGETPTFQNFFGYHPPEQAQDGSGRSFRWTSSPLAAITVPFIQHIQPIVIETVLCGCRFDGQTTPVQFEVNNTPLVDFQATDEWRRYHLLVPSDLPQHPEYGVMLVINAELWQTPASPRIGVAVESITLRQATRPPLTEPATLPLLIAALLGLAVWQRTPLPLLLLTGAWGALGVLYQPHMLPRPHTTALLLTGVLVLWTLVPRRPPAVPTAPAAHHPTWRQDALYRWFPLTAATLIGAWLVLSVQVLGHWIIDDAFISFRYARNLVAGHGLVFNPGEYVEGYTNFLWTVLIAAGMAVQLEPILFANVGLVLIAFLIAWLTVAIGQLILPPDYAPFAWLAAAVLVVNSPFLIYTARSSGMETGLYAMLILATLLALLHQRWLLAGTLTTLTLMTRPDGILLVGVAGLYALWQGWQQHRPTTPPLALRLGWWRWLMPALRYTAPLLLLYLPYFLWRWNYYGYPLPNTFYVKVGSSEAQLWRGVEYLRDFALATPLFGFGVLGALVGLWAWRGTEPPRWAQLALLGGLLTLITTYVIAVGGDWMPGFRFFIATLPLLVLFGVWGMVGLVRRIPHLLLPVLLGLAGLGVGQAMLLPNDTSYVSSPIWVQNYAVRRYREVGRWINMHTTPDTWISTAVAGAMPYYADRPTIDILGLTDEHIAHLPVADLGRGRPGHEKTDLDYALGREPEIIPYKGSDLFWRHPRFKANYTIQDFPGPEGQAVRLYVRNDVVLPNTAGGGQEVAR